MESKTILILDDEQSFCYVCAAILREEGYRTVCAFSGEEALQKLRDTDTVDLILSDVNLPGMSGLDFLAHVQRAGKKPPPCILITVHEFQDLYPKLQGRSIAGYMNKPIDFHELKRLIHQVLQNHRRDSSEAGGT